MTCIHFITILNRSKYLKYKSKELGRKSVLTSSVLRASSKIYVYCFKIHILRHGLQFQDHCVGFQYLGAAFFGTDFSLSLNPFFAAAKWLAEMGRICPFVPCLNTYKPDNTRYFVIILFQSNSNWSPRKKKHRAQTQHTLYVCSL